MKVNTIALTVEVDEIDNIKNVLRDVKKLGGKNVNNELIESIENSLDNLRSEQAALELAGKTAGICYMKDDYFSTDSSKNDKAFKRGRATIGLGHHSVADHGSVTLLLGGIPKIIAMLLNNTQYYTTSEKSARYTTMQPNTDLELKVYNKWCEKYAEIIKDKYPGIDDATIEKLAKENARYLISVFTLTTMAYTTSYRQISYILDWCDKLKETFSRNGKHEDFYVNTFNELQKFKELLANEVSANICYDIKNRGFDLLLMEKPEDKEIIDDVYLLNYKATFAEVAQAQRHRTLTYQIYVNTENTEFYIPKIIRGTDYQDEWLQDMNSVAYCYPQGMLVDVLERGTFENFILKAKERMCGRAQLEICDITTSQMQKFIDNKHKLSSVNQELLDKHIKNGEVCTKCLMDNFKCKEVCFWGSKNGLSRLI